MDAIPTAQTPEPLRGAGNIPCRKWTVGFQYCERQFTSEPMPRAIAEQVQDGIENELRVIAWLDPVAADLKALGMAEHHQSTHIPAR